MINNRKFKRLLRKHYKNQIRFVITINNAQPNWKATTINNYRKSLKSLNQVNNDDRYVSLRIIKRYYYV